MLSQQKNPARNDGKLTRPTAETADSLAGIYVKKKEDSRHHCVSPQEEKKKPLYRL